MDERLTDNFIASAIALGKVMGLDFIDIAFCAMRLHDVALLRAVDEMTGGSLMGKISDLMDFDEMMEELMGGDDEDVD